MTRYDDIADRKEDDQIRQIGEYVTHPSQSGKITGFVVDNHAKADRYLEKLLERFPDIAVIDRFDGPVCGVVTVRIRNNKTH